jgi:hypothetical protein
MSLRIIIFYFVSILLQTYVLDGGVHAFCSLFPNIDMCFNCTFIFRLFSLLYLPYAVHKIKSILTDLLFYSLFP